MFDTKYRFSVWYRLSVTLFLNAFVEKIVRQLYLRSYSFRQPFKIQWFFLCCPICQCGLFQKLFDVGFEISVCFQADFAIFRITFPSRDSFRDDALQPHNHKLRSFNLKHKDSFFHHLQPLFVEGNIIWQYYLRWPGLTWRANHLCTKTAI